MIYGIGHDVVEISRMSKILDSGYAQRFLQRILTQAEFALPGSGSRMAEFASGRFAAKEAVSKALGSGIGAKLSFGDIEVLPDACGKPQVYIIEEAWLRLGLPDGSKYSIHLSITHERSLASAFCVVESRD